MRLVVRLLRVHNVRSRLRRVHDADPRGAGEGLLPCGHILDDGAHVLKRNYRRQLACLSLPPRLQVALDHFLYRRYKTADLNEILTHRDNVAGAYGHLAAVQPEDAGTAMKPAF